MPRRLRDLRLGSDEAVSDADQTSSDADQTSSDADQSISDRDQDAAEADQLVSDSDQEAADLEFKAGESSDAGRTHAYEEAQAKRGEGTLARSATGAVRAQISAERDAQAVHRDEQARRRDDTAAERDSASDLADQEAAELAGSVEDINDQTRTALGAAATARSKAATARIKAAEDRRHAALDREAAARDRQQLQAEIHRSQLDELTGAYRRGIGELLVSHEMERARRVGRILHLAFIDVDRLKATNDDLGHAAGDDILRRVFSAFQARLRPYDPIIRWGGDEFVCAIPGLTTEDALNRVLGARSDLAQLDPSISVSTGLAVLEDEDTLTMLVARADAALIEARRQRRSPGSA
jgi:diguanylate cyclase (GGDEF)-like protein